LATFWRARFGAPVLARTFWRGLFWRGTFWRGVRFGAHVLALDTFWRHTKKKHRTVKNILLLIIHINSCILWKFYKIYSIEQKTK
jgi:hypothetical protein